MGLVYTVYGAKMPADFLGYVPVGTSRKEHCPLLCILVALILREESWASTLYLPHTSVHL